MAIDSTAELLFRIGADTDDAQSNIARFRTLLSKDLGDIAGEFSDWSSKVFGSLTTVSGAMTAGGAAIAAVGVAAVAAFQHASDKYVEYALEIEKGMRVTGLGAKAMSELYNAADDTRTSYDALTTGLVRFQRNIIAAASGSEEQIKSFKAVGISQKDLAAGQKDLMPLLYKVADAFQQNSSGAQKGALAFELMGRQGVQLVEMLSKGSEGFRQMAESARQAGQILTDEDIRAVREFKLAQDALSDSQQGIEIAMGKSTMQLRIWANALEAATLQTLTTQSVWKTLGELATTWGWAELFSDIKKNYAGVREEIERMTKAAKNAKGEPPPLANPAAVKETAQEYYGLSTVLDSIKGKIGAAGDAQDKLNAELEHLNGEIVKATDEFNKLFNENKLAPDAITRELAALSQMVEQIGILKQKATEKAIEGQFETEEKAMAALDEVHRTLTDRLAGYQSEDWQLRRGQFNREIDELTEQSQKKAQLTQAEMDLLAEIRRAGIAKIDREQLLAFEQELGQLQNSLAQQYQLTLTSRDRLDFAYQMELQRFSEVEEQKALATAQSEQEQQVIRALFAANRKQLLDNYKADLHALLNSQGWQGVFGNHFAQLIRNNEKLLREWVTSTHQATLLVKVSLESLKQIGKETFDEFSRAMGGNIAQAIVYSQSIGQAMRAALASTLESLAAQSLMQAIYATAIGFLRLAEWDYPAAEAAFTAAGIFASVGIGAALAGRAIAPKQLTGAGASGSGAGASGSGAGAGSDSGASGGAGNGQPKTSLSIHVYGNVYGRNGAQELVDMINAQVYENDASLLATHTREGVPL